MAADAKYGVDFHWDMAYNICKLKAMTKTVALMESHREPGMVEIRYE